MAKSIPLRDIDHDKVPAFPRPSRTALLLGVVLVVLTLIAYAPAMRGSFIWDDDDYVTQNPTLRSVEGLRDIWLSPRATPQYYPLVHTTFWIEYQLWGANAPGYHVVNILLHAISAVLLWRLLVMLEIPAAFLAACVFATHPVQAESVAWITERKNVLSGLFYFASALSFVAWASRPSAKNTLCFLSILFFIAAMLSKTVACSLPAALLLVLWWKHGRVTKRHWLALAPMFLIAIPLAMYTAHLEVAHVRAIGREWDFTFAQRILIAGRAIWFYVAKFLIPINLSFVYPQWSPIDPHLAWQWGFPIGVIVALAVLWLMRDRWGRGPLVAALIFCGTLLPALGFFNIYPMRYTFVADHYQYHASVALCVLLAIGLTRLFGRFAYWPLAMFLVLTMIRARVLSDPLRLWQDTFAKNPDSWMVNLNLARVLNDRGPREREASWELFARLPQLAPDVPESHWNFGSSLAQQGRIDDAIAQYTNAIDLIEIPSNDEQTKRTSPLPQVYFLRAKLLRRTGKLEAAEADLLRAIELKPDMAEAFVELANVYAKQGRNAEARHAFEHAQQLDPTIGETH